MEWVRVVKDSAVRNGNGLFRNNLVIILVFFDLASVLQRYVHASFFIYSFHVYEPIPAISFHPSHNSPFFPSPLTESASPSPLASPLPITLMGPLFTIRLMTSNSVSAAAMVVCSALVSYAGATSTMSAATKLMPSRPRMMVRSSRVDQPPVSGVPVAGATMKGGVFVLVLVCKDQRVKAGDKGARVRGSYRLGLGCQCRWIDRRASRCRPCLGSF